MKDQQSPPTIRLIRLSPTSADGVMLLEAFESVPRTLEDLQNLVGGLVEFLPTDGKLGLDIIVNEDFIALDLPVNESATAVWEENGDMGCIAAGQVVRGPALFVGQSDEEGNVTDMPKPIWDIMLVASFGSALSDEEAQKLGLQEATTTNTPQGEEEE